MVERVGTTRKKTAQHPAKTGAAKAGAAKTGAAKAPTAKRKRIGLDGAAKKNRLIAEAGQGQAALGPDLIPLARVFAAQPGLDVGKISRELETAFNDLASLRERNPFGNSVKLLALDIN